MQVFTQSFHPPRRVKATQIQVDKPVEFPLRSLPWWWTCPTPPKDGQIDSSLLSRIRLPLSSFNILLPESIFSYLCGQHTLLPSLIDSPSRSVHCPTIPSRRSDKLVMPVRLLSSFILQQYQPYVRISSRWKILLSFWGKSHSTWALWGSPYLTPANSYREFCHAYQTSLHHDSFDSGCLVLGS